MLLRWYLILSFIYKCSQTVECIKTLVYVPSMHTNGHEKCTAYMIHLYEVQEEVKQCSGNGGNQWLSGGESGIFFFFLNIYPLGCAGS